jgi:hypothetical protein
MIRISARDVTPRECEQCKNPFVPMKGSAGRFCSRKCSGAYRTAHLERFLCDQCGKVIEHRIFQNQGYKNYFCGQPCLQLFRSQNRMTLEERYWKYAVKTDGCWEWSGFTDEMGYGRVSAFTSDDRWVPHLAHRISWELHFGPIPDELLVLHRCDNPPCSRPDHLFLGTQLDNVRDCIAKGRNNRIGHSSGVGLTELQVAKIKQRFRDGERNFTALGKEYGVSRHTISDIFMERTWKNVP